MLASLEAERAMKVPISASLLKVLPGGTWVWAKDFSTCVDGSGAIPAAHADATRATPDAHANAQHATPDAHANAQDATPDAHANAQHATPDARRRQGEVRSHPQTRPDLFPHSGKDFDLPCTRNHHDALEGTHGIPLVMMGN